MSESKAPRRISRRTVVKGAAWAIPAVPIVVATPAYAASGNPPKLTMGDACKLPGNSCSNFFVKGYVFEMTITNTTALDIWLYDQTGYEIVLTDDNPDISLYFNGAIILPGGAPLVFPYLLPAGQTVNILLNAGVNGTSAQESISGTISMPWGHTQDPTQDTWNHPNDVIEYSYAATPPVNGDQCQIVLPANCGKA